MFFFCKQKTAYELRISDWSSDVCSSDLVDAGMNEIMSEEVVAAVMMDRPRVAVILPCYNEEAAIAQTVHSFREALPHADIYVYDNNSGDRTREIAEAAGAVVRPHRMQGKRPEERSVGTECVRMGRTGG